MPKAEFSFSTFHYISLTKIIFAGNESVQTMIFKYELKLTTSLKQLVVVSVILVTAKIFEDTQLTKHPALYWWMFLLFKQVNPI